MDYQRTYRKSLDPLTSELSGKSSKRQLYQGASVDAETSVATPYISTTQQVAVADALTTTSSYWFLALENVTARGGHGSSLSEQSDSIHTLTGDNYQPFSLGACLPDSIRSDIDTRPLALPLLQEANDPAIANVNMTLQSGQVRKAIVLPGLSRADIMSNPGNSSQYRLQWVDLPQPQFNGSSIGAIIMLPRPVSNLTAPQDIILCNLAAGWGTTTLQMQQFDGGFGSVSSQISKHFPDPGSSLENSISPTPGNANDEIYWFYTQFPQRPANITQEWAQYLNPIVRSANRSVFDIIMQEVDRFAPPQASNSAENTAREAPGALVWMMTNGLARIGFESRLQGSPKSVKSVDGTSWIDGNYWLSGKGNMFEVDPTQSKDWLKFHVNSTLEGYAYNTETVAPRVAIGIMTLYCIIALAHLFYSGISGTWSASSSPICVSSRLTTHVYHRHKLYLLGLNRRSHRLSHELYSHDRLAQHVCWHHRAIHFPVARARVGTAGRGGRRGTSRARLWECKRWGERPPADQGEQNLRDDAFVEAAWLVRSADIISPSEWFDRMFDRDAAPARLCLAWSQKYAFFLLWLSVAMSAPFSLFLWFSLLSTHNNSTISTSLYQIESLL